jgi:hypothetical protein
MNKNDFYYLLIHYIIKKFNLDYEKWIYESESYFGKLNNNYISIYISKDKQISYVLNGDCFSGEQAIFNLLKIFNYTR